MKEQTFLIIFLLACLLIYLIIIAFVFEYLETENEIDRIKQSENLFKNLQQRNNISLHLMKEIRHVVERNYELGVTIYGQKYWDFTGSFYFAWTVLTTIGFGHVAPVTASGKLVVIVFALTSIPLYILLMNLLLEQCIALLKSTLQRLYKCAPVRYVIKQKEMGMLPVGRVIILTSGLFIIYTTIFAVLFAIMEKWSYFEGLYFMVVSTTTVGLGDYVPSKYKHGNNTHISYRLLNWIVLMFGLLITYVLLNLTATIYKNLLSFATEKLNTKIAFLTKEVSKEVESRRRSRLQSSSSSISFLDDSEGLGSFAAIQRGIDRIRQKHQNGETPIESELKAVNTIEAILQNEYRKAQLRQGDEPAAKWRRAASRARIQARRKISNVYKSMLGEEFLTTLSNSSTAVNETGSIERKQTLAVKQPVGPSRKYSATVARRTSHVSVRRQTSSPEIVLENNEEGTSLLDNILCVSNSSTAVNETGSIERKQTLAVKQSVGPSRKYSATVARRISHVALRKQISSPEIVLEHNEEGTSLLDNILCVSNSSTAVNETGSIERKQTLAVKQPAGPSRKHSATVARRISHVSLRKQNSSPEIVLENNEEGTSLSDNTLSVLSDKNAISPLCFSLPRNGVLSTPVNNFEERITEENEESSRKALEPNPAILVEDYHQYGDKNNAKEIATYNEDTLIEIPIGENDTSSGAINIDLNENSIALHDKRKKRSIMIVDIDTRENEHVNNQLGTLNEENSILLPTSTSSSNNNTVCSNTHVCPPRLKERCYNRNSFPSTSSSSAQKDTLLHVNKESISKQSCPGITCNPSFYSMQNIKKSTRTNIDMIAGISESKEQVDPRERSSTLVMLRKLGHMHFLQDRNTLI